MKAITVENLSKMYSVTTAQEQGMSFREMLTGQMQSFFTKGPKQEPFYALKDVSFEVEQGEVLGIIGKNGSGKSTLLKILSKITAPTSGKAIVRGRVASLLEVGTGFHAELTGRENIFMSGIILGMKRWEINKHFDEIVSFAGVEKFLDIPVKKYSSGMRLRLAFSVAAHLQPEILLVDEVLAVGDYEFEKKCLKVIEGITQAGRTILFVSHNMDTVKRLCSKVLFLKAGQLQYQGSAEEVVSKYFGYSIKDHCLAWKNILFDSNIINVQQIKVINPVFVKQNYLRTDKSIAIEMSYKIKDIQSRLFFFLEFYNEQGNLLFTATEQLHGGGNIGDKYTSTVCVVPPYIFKEEVIRVSFRIGNAGKEGKALESNYVLGESNILSFKMYDSEKKEDNFIWTDSKDLIKPQLYWETIKNDNI